MTRRTLYVPVMIAAAVAVAAVGLLVVTMLVVGGRPAGATFPGPNGKIAYVVDDGMYPSEFDSEIYTIKPGGGTPFNVTDEDLESFTPEYSPNGKKIAYGSRGDIYTINAGGGGKTRVTNYDSMQAGSPSWGRRP